MNTEDEVDTDDTFKRVVQTQLMWSFAANQLYDETALWWGGEAAAKFSAEIKQGRTLRAAWEVAVAGKSGPLTVFPEVYVGPYKIVYDMSNADIERLIEELNPDAEVVPQES